MVISRHIEGNPTISAWFAIYWETIRLPGTPAGLRHVLVYLELDASGYKNFKISSMFASNNANISNGKFEGFRFTQTGQIFIAPMHGID